MQALAAYRNVLDALAEGERYTGKREPPIHKMAREALLPAIVAWVAERPLSDESMTLSALANVCALALVVAVTASTAGMPERRRAMELLLKRADIVATLHLALLEQRAQPPIDPAALSRRYQ